MLASPTATDLYVCQIAITLLSSCSVGASVGGLVMFGVPCGSQPTTLLSSYLRLPGGLDSGSVPFVDFQLEYQVLDTEADLARTAVKASVRPVQLTYDFVSAICCDTVFTYMCVYIRAHVCMIVYICMTIPGLNIP